MCSGNFQKPSCPGSVRPSSWWHGRPAYWGAGHPLCLAKVAKEVSPQAPIPLPCNHGAPPAPSQGRQPTGGHRGPGLGEEPTWIN